jgi:hypothetical protein
MRDGNILKSAAKYEIRFTRYEIRIWSLVGNWNLVSGRVSTVRLSFQHIAVKKVVDTFNFSVLIQKT